MGMEQIRDGMRLMAGEAGLYRNIRWIYFADCTQCLNEDFNLAELIHGEELVIVTNASLTDHDDKIIDMIRVMSVKNITAFVINEGQISQRVIDYCNEIELPLYELSVSLHLIDLSQIVCRALVEEEIHANSRERVLSDILYSDHLQIDEIMKQAGYLGVSLSGRQQVIVVRMRERDGEEGSLMEIQEQMKKYVKTEFHSYGAGNLMILSQADSVVILLPAGLFSRDLLATILMKVIRRGESSCGISMKAGIGTGYEYIEDFKKSWQEAKNALAISGILNQEEKVYFYEELGIYSLIAQISNGKFLDEYMESKIGRLIEADQMQEGDLCETLEAYLEHNCNANATAEALFIHRNTMRYRMNKIRRILDDDISDISVFLELKLAFAIKRYRENRDV